MRFSVLAATLVSASAVLAHDKPTSTVYITDVITTTNCASTVTDCPAHSTVVSTTSYPVYPTSSPGGYSNSTIVPPYPSSTPAETPVYPTSSPEGVPTSYPEGVPTSTPEGVITVTVTTCLPTTYETVITPPAPTSTPAGVPTYPGGVASPSGTGAPTYPVSPAPPAFTGAASSVQGSIAVAAAAGLAAFLFA